MPHQHEGEHVCPWWMGYVLASPLRRLRQNPRKILSPWLEPGMLAVEVGPGMGFFTFDMAKITGPTGRIVAVDLQPKMLRALDNRARRKGLLEQIETRECAAESLGLDDLNSTVDFILAFAVVHEVPDAGALFSELHKLLKPGGSLLFAEPRMVQDDAAFDASLEVAIEKGFMVEQELAIKSYRSRLLRL